MKGGGVMTEPENRADRRQRIAAPIVFSYFNRGPAFDSQTLNHCASGLCIKSDFYLHPGATVYIRVKKFPPNGSPMEVNEALRSATLGEVKWCREISDASPSYYRVGVKYFQPEY